MRIIYMGTPEFAVAPLEALLNEGYEVAAVITAPDKPAGRGKNTSGTTRQRICRKKRTEDPPTGKTQKCRISQGSKLPSCRPANRGGLPDAAGGSLGPATPGYL